jgi:hypothetical protein
MKEDDFWRSAVRWILKFRGARNISNGTLYLAISYLRRLVQRGLRLTANNSEHIAATLVLLSAKMNEIYPPTMTELLRKCKDGVTKDEMVLM